MSKIKFGAFPAKHQRMNNRNGMVFAPNPLSLSVPEPEFESWLRDSGYLEIVDQRTSDLHRLSKTATAKPSDSSADDAVTTSIAPIGVNVFSQFFSRIWTLLSLLTFNPFAKLATEDFAGDTPPWAPAFFGSLESYSFPSSPSQARLRVHENVKRFARNYALLTVVFFACSLYQLPIALFGLISCLALWEVFKFSAGRWGLDRYPMVRQTLVHLAQCVAGIALFTSNVHVAIFFALSVSYAVMILHAAFRKLTGVKQSEIRGGNRGGAR